MPDNKRTNMSDNKKSAPSQNQNSRQGADFKNRQTSGQSSRAGRAKDGVARLVLLSGDERFDEGVQIGDREKIIALEPVVMTRVR